MHAEPVTQEDRASSMEASIRPRAPWRVQSVRQTGPNTLEVQFNDGTSGRVEMRQLVNSPGAGVFAALTDPALFKRVFVELGAVAWPGGLDLAPDAMYADIRRDGVCVPT